MISTHLFFIVTHSIITYCHLRTLMNHHQTHERFRLVRFGCEPAAPAGNGGGGRFGDGCGAAAGGDAVGGEGSVGGGREPAGQRGRRGRGDRQVQRGEPAKRGERGESGVHDLHLGLDGAAQRGADHARQSEQPDSVAPADV